MIVEELYRDTMALSPFRRESQEEPPCSVSLKTSVLIGIA